MDRDINKIIFALSYFKSHFAKTDEARADFDAAMEIIEQSVVIPSADMFSDLKAEISMYENSEQSIDEMIQGIKSIISFYER